MLIISQVKSDAEIMAVQDLIHEFTAWVFTLQDDSEHAPTFENLEEELANLPGIYTPPRGTGKLTWNIYTSVRAITTRNAG